MSAPSLINDDFVISRFSVTPTSGSYPSAANSRPFVWVQDRKVTPVKYYVYLKFRAKNGHSFSANHTYINNSNYEPAGGSNELFHTLDVVSTGSETGNEELILIRLGLNVPSTDPERLRIRLYLPQTQDGNPVYKGGTTISLPEPDSDQA